MPSGWSQRRSGPGGPHQFRPGQCLHRGAGDGRQPCATAALAERLALHPDQVLICSTGVIGVPIPMDTLLAGLDPLVAALSP